MKTKKLLISILLGLTLVVTTLVGACAKPTPAPEEPIELKFATLFTDPVPYATVPKLWMEKIESETNGRVHFTAYWGGTLIDPREAFSQLTQGVFDIGWCCIGYTPTGFELNKAYMPFYYSVPDPAVRRRIDEEVRAKFPELNAEFADWKILQVYAGGNNQLISREPIRKVDDFGGLSIRAGGPDVDVVKKLGAEGAAMSMGEIYMALQKGILDGAFVPWETLYSFKFGEVAPYVTTVDYAYSPYPQHFMNLDKWNMLPSDIQKVFDDNMEFWNSEEDKAFMIAHQGGMEYAKETGVEISQLPSEEQKKFFEAWAAVASELAATLDAKGYRGTEILKEVLRLAEKYSE